jgi:hypothetical protein
MAAVIETETRVTEVHIEGLVSFCVEFKLLSKTLKAPMKKGMF